MKGFRILILSLGIGLIFAIGGGGAVNFKIAPENPDYKEWINKGKKSEFGWIPPAMDLNYIKPLVYGTKIPSSWDWRTLGKVTPVKNQGSCGTCWAFGGCANFESQILITESLSLDLSEEYLKECDFNPTQCDGAFPNTAFCFFTRYGAVLEPCMPYRPYPASCDATCLPSAGRVNGWRLIVGNGPIGPTEIQALKEACYNYGPIYCGIDGYSLAGYSGGCIEIGGSTINHAVLIVGYDDAMSCAKAYTGGWIAKNSWGASWGENGFFRMAYNSGSIGVISSTIVSYEAYNPLIKIYYHDPNGWLQNVGYSQNTAYAACKFYSSQKGQITHIEFFTTAPNCQYTVWLYDTWSGGPSGLIQSKSGTCNEAGYYSIALDSPVNIQPAEDFVIVAHFYTPGYNYPIAIDFLSPTSPGRAWVSYNGTNWDDTHNYFNPCLRARVFGPEITLPDINFIGMIALIFGFSVILYLIKMHRRREFIS